MRLGGGGQAAVFKAEVSSADGANASAVAVKIYFADQLEERTAREVDALKKLSGDTIVRFHSEGTCQLRGRDCRYIATSFVEGETVAAALSRGSLSMKQVARVGHDAALAISEMWRHRLVHRDLKPPNIMLAASGRAVVIDLGIVRDLALSPLTTAGKVWGTEGYLSPEQCTGRPLSCKSDVFALGIVLQQCLLGQHPTGGRQPNLLMGGPPTASLQSGLDPRVCILIDQMVVRYPHLRPDSERIAAELVPFLE